ncbi:hypothetical protein RRG08_020172, partial [Elysia crispata]
MITSANMGNIDPWTKTSGATEINIRLGEILE